LTYKALLQMNNQIFFSIIGKFYIFKINLSL
jgi:hypothetical protein